MAYLARLLTDTVPIEQIRSFAVRFVAITPVHAQPTCVGHVRPTGDGNGDGDGEEWLTLDLAVRLADGTTTLVGEAAVSVD